MFGKLKTKLSENRYVYNLLKEAGHIKHGLKRTIFLIGGGGRTVMETQI